LIDEQTSELPAVPEIEDPADEWPVRGPAKGIRLRLPLAALAASALVAGGFWGGAAVEKGHASTSGAAAALAARFRGGAAGGFAGGAAGFGSATGGTTAAATGTVSVVDANTLYVLTSSGSLVKVTLGQSTPITRNAKASAVDLRPGDTVVVQGSTGTDGNVTATSVAATGPGAAAN
jgi:hypothetical protein